MTGAGGFVDRVEYLHQHNAVLRGGFTFTFAEAAGYEMTDLAVEQPVEIERGVAEGLDVDEHTVHIGEEFDLRIDAHAGFRAEQLDVADVVLEVEVEA